MRRGREPGGILNEHVRAGDRFRDVHAELPGKLVEACRRPPHRANAAHERARGGRRCAQRVPAHEVSRRAGGSRGRSRRHRGHELPAERDFRARRQLLQPVRGPARAVAAGLSPRLPGGAIRAGVRRRRGSGISRRAWRRNNGGTTLRAVRAAHVHASRAGRLYRRGHRPPAADRRARRPIVAAPGTGARTNSGQAVQHRQLPLDEDRQRLREQRPGAARVSRRAVWRASCRAISGGARGTHGSAACGHPPAATEGVAGARQTKSQSSTPPSASR